MLISSVVPKLPHHPDFAVVDILAAADFGWEYLVRDATGLWVLEEFLPSAETPQDLPTLQAMLTDRLQSYAAMLDDRSGAIVDPQFASSHAIRIIDERLFWQREYIPGTRYQQLLDTAIAQNEVFTEDAIWDFLEDVLTPLAQLHDRGLVHGAIDLNAVICREGDGQIVLQRSGGIREFGLTHHFYQLQPLLMAQAEPRLSGVAQDLYDLARLALVLLTGDGTIDSVSQVFEHLQQVGVISEALAAILTPMLMPKPWQKFHDARDVLQTLCMESDEESLEHRTASALPPPALTTQPTKTPPTVRDPIILALTIVFVCLGALALWRIVHMLRRPVANNPPTPSIGKFSGKATANVPALSTKPGEVAPPKSPTASNSPPEKQGIPAELYDRLITELAPSTKPPEPPVNSILNGLSEEARRELGTYYRRNYDRWFATLTARKISQPTVDILADTAFYLRFPPLQGKTLNPRTFGQLWYAIARDQITALNQQQNLKILTAGDFNESGKLNQGYGRVFQVQLQPGEHLQVRLKGQKPDVRLSVIENEIVLTRDSLNTQWTAPPALRTTTYEIILTPLKLDPVSYTFSLQR